MDAIRPFREEDRAAVTALGETILDWWNRHTALHLVIGEPAIAHLQVVDRSTTPVRRRGQLEMRLIVAPEHRRRGLGSLLYDRALAFASERQGEALRASYVEHTPTEPASHFLRRHGFVELQRFCPSRLDVAACDLQPFEGVGERLIAQGARFFTYADVPDTAPNRRRLHALETEARQDVPYRAIGPWALESFEAWLEEFEKVDRSTLELAEMDGRWVGMSTSSTSWGFTGVLRAYRGRGIATALKVRAIRTAKQRGVPLLETENHAENHAMLAINRKLGYQFGPQEVECIRWLR
jgi:GNAT superfamily N-acetyltransferase